MITLYGIPNCDACRNARKWLDSQGIAHLFHDIRVDGLEVKDVHQWAAKAGWKSLLNTRSKTWRLVPQVERENIDSGRALKLMFEQPNLIKRPVLVSDKDLLVGFSEASYSAFFAANPG